MSTRQGDGAGGRSGRRSSSFSELDTGGGGSGRAARRSSSFTEDNDALSPTRRPSLQRRPSRDGSFNLGERRPSFDESGGGGGGGGRRTSRAERRRSIKSDPALHASAMDRVLRLTVDDATPYLGADDPAILVCACVRACSRK